MVIGVGMRVAYLSNQYPSVSHTFIRRELIEVEKLLGPIERFSVRTSTQTLVDPLDKAEREQTFTLLSQDPIAWTRALRQPSLSSGPC